MPLYAANGIVRAIHGGGPNKGSDFFALCGNPARPATPAASYSDASGAYWSEGDPVLTDCATGGDAESRTAALVRSSSALNSRSARAKGSFAASRQLRRSNQMSHDTSMITSATVQSAIRR